MTKQSPPELEAIEILRRNLEKVAHQTGSLYDYLDHGRPSDEQKAQTWETIRVLEAEKQFLGSQLDAMVNQWRRENPGLLERWVAIHESTYRDVRTEYDTGQELDAITRRTKVFVADQALNAWGEVRTGERNYVLANWYLMDQHWDTVRRHFGF